MASSIVEVCEIGDKNNTTVVDVMRERKVSASLGYGYHEFVSLEFISPNTKVVLEDQVSKVFSCRKLFLRINITSKLVHVREGYSTLFVCLWSLATSL